MSGPVMTYHLGWLRDPHRREDGGDRQRGLGCGRLRRGSPRPRLPQRFELEKEPPLQAGGAPRGFQGGRTPVLLLLTATPMQLDPKELYSLVELLDPALFPTVETFEEHRKLLPELNRLVRAVENYGDLPVVASILSDGSRPTTKSKTVVLGELAAHRYRAA